MNFQEEKKQEQKRILEKCEFEFSQKQEDYVGRIKITGDLNVAKKYTLHFLIKNLLFPLSEKFIFIFDVVNFISVCERIDNYFTGSRNPIKTLNEGMKIFFEEILKRPDIISCITFIEFFKIEEKNSKSSLLPLKELISVKIKVWEDEMLVHNVSYDPDNRTLVLNCKLNGLFANFGRIWSVVEKVNLSAVEVYHMKYIAQGNRIELNHKLTFMSQDMISDVRLYLGQVNFQKSFHPNHVSHQNQDSSEDIENCSDALNESVLTVSNWHQE
jgi:hypothetical protein